MKNAGIQTLAVIATLQHYYQEGPWQWLQSQFLVLFQNPRFLFHAKRKINFFDNFLKKNDRNL